MAEDLEETVRQLRERIAVLEQSNAGTTVRPERVAFAQWLLKTKNLDSEDFQALTPNGKGVLQAEFAAVQAVEARKVEERAHQAKRVVLPPGAEAWPAEKRIGYANLVQANASDEEYSARGYPIPRKETE